MSKSLYICYFGMLEPLVQTQVLPYLRELVNDDEWKSEKGEKGKRGFKISLLTFEPEVPRDADQIRDELFNQGIEWHWLRYHKWPSVPATFYDVFRGTMFVRRFINKNKPDILHGRVHLPTLIGAVARKLSRHKPKLLFDIRGFFPEEYTDAGIWREDGWLYRGAKRVERWLLKEADGFVVLTEKAREILFPESRETGLDKLGRPVEVIPCCVDIGSRFSGDREALRRSIREEMGNDGRFVITHLGALGGLYLTNDLADLLAVARDIDPTTFAMFLTQSDPSKIVPLMLERGFTQKDFFVGKVPPTEIQKYLYASDIGLSFIKLGYAAASRSPTKVPEYLVCGLPVIANRGVGDVYALIESNRVGAIVSDLSHNDYRLALAAVRELGDISERCRTTARREFDLETVGGARYRRIYKRLLEQ